MDVTALAVRVGPGDTYGSLWMKVARVIADDNPWGARPWTTMHVVQPDKPVFRAIGFWRRYGSQLDPGAEHLEAMSEREGRVLRVAARAAENRAQLHAISKQSSRWGTPSVDGVTLLPRSEAHMERLVQSIADLRIGTADGYLFLAHLSALMAREGGCLMFGDETERHQSCLRFCGDRGAINDLQTALLRVLDPTAIQDSAFWNVSGGRVG